MGWKDEPSKLKSPPKPNSRWLVLRLSAENEILDFTEVRADSAYWAIQKATVNMTLSNEGHLIVFLIKD